MGHRRLSFPGCHASRLLLADAVPTLAGFSWPMLLSSAASGPAKGHSSPGRLSRDLALCSCLDGGWGTEGVGFCSQAGEDEGLPLTRVQSPKAAALGGP